MTSFYPRKEGALSGSGFQGSLSLGIALCSLSLAAASLPAPSSPAAPGLLTDPAPLPLLVASVQSYTVLSC